MTSAIDSALHGQQEFATLDAVAASEKSEIEALEPHIAACERLLELVPQRLANDDGERAPLRSILIAFTFRAATTYEATIVLLRHAFSEQALMLSRSIYEDSLDSRWALARPEEAVDAFNDHALLANERGRNAAVEYADLMPELQDSEAAKRPPLSDEERARLKERFGPYGTRSWTGLSSHKRLEAVKSSAGPEEFTMLELMNDLGLGLANRTLHPSAPSLYAHLSGPHGKSSSVSVRRGPNPALTKQALLIAAWSFGELLWLLYTEFTLDRKLLGSIYGDAIRSIIPDA